MLSNVDEEKKRGTIYKERTTIYFLFHETDEIFGLMSVVHQLRLTRGGEKWTKVLRVSDVIKVGKAQDAAVSKALTRFADGDSGEPEDEGKGEYEYEGSPVRFRAREKKRHGTYTVGIGLPRQNYGDDT